MLSFWDKVNGIWTRFTSISSSAGAADAGKIPGLDAAGKLDPTFIYGEPERVMTAGASLTAPALVSVYDSGAGVIKVRYADATDATKRAVGFILDNIANGATGKVYFRGTMSGLTGLTIGSTYYLDKTVPGGVIIEASAPTSSGNIQQKIGIALSTTEIETELGEIAQY